MERIRKLEQAECCHASFNLEGNLVAISSWAWDPPVPISVYEPETGGLKHRITQSPYARSAFSPDGGGFVTASTTAYTFWDVKNWQHHRSIPWRSHLPGHVDFSPNGQLIAITSTNHLVRLIDPKTGEEVATLTAPEQMLISGVRFSPTGTHVVVITEPNHVFLWDLRSIRQQLRRINLDWDQPPLPPTPKKVVPVQVNINADPHSAYAWKNRGLSHYDQKNLSAAIDAYTKAIEIDPNCALAWNNLGNAQRDQMKVSEAIESYKKALAIDPHHAALWRNLGFALETQKNLPEAIDAYKKAVEVDPKHFDSWRNLALALQNQKYLSAAIDAYKKALAINSKHVPTHLGLGIALRDRKNLPAALDAYQKALAIAPQSAAAWNNIGVVLRDQKDYPAAIEAYEKALAINPKYPIAWNNLGFALRERKDLPAAIDAFQKALAGDPNYAFAQKNLASAKQMLAQDKRLPGVLSGDPAGVAELLALADFSARFKERYHDAAALFAKAFAADPAVAEQLARPYRYNAACCAALAAAGKGRDAENLDAMEKTHLRNQAIDWLQADLGARARMFERDPVQTHKAMQLWLRDSDLASIRAEAEVAKLPAAERDVLRKLWKEVDDLVKRVGASCTQTEHPGKLSSQEREQEYRLKMIPGKTYVIDMESRHFDTYLRIESNQRKVIAENNDVSSTDLNSQIVFSVPTVGDYYMVAASNGQRGAGGYTITIREFMTKKD